MRAHLDPLPLTFDFRTAYGPTRKKTNALLTIEDYGSVGYGEILLVDPPSERYPLLKDDIPDDLTSDVPSRQVASALSVANVDLYYRVHGIALSQRCRPGVRSYRTLPIINDLEDARIALDGILRHTPLVKAKVGADPAYCAALLPLLPSVAIIDANGSWTPERAMEILPYMPRGTILEQPFAQPSPDWLPTRAAYAREGIRIFADESFFDETDFARHNGLIDGVVVKLEKHRGLIGTDTMMRAAQARGLEVVLGCNLVSTLGVSAASLLAPHADYVDLDSTHFLDPRTDPFSGTRVEKDGELIYSDMPGIANLKCDGREGI